MAITKEFTLTSLENVLKKRGWVRSSFAKAKRIIRPRFSMTVAELCELSGVDVKKQPSIHSVLKRKVQKLSNVHPYFYTSCICVEMYDDTDDDLRWAILKGGAIAVVSHHQIDDLPCIVVDNPQLIYSKMCRYYRDLSKAKTVAITGSIGKTTTKRMIGSVLREEFNISCCPTNDNALYHIGFEAQHIPCGTEIIVDEISEDTPRYTSLMSKIAHPKVVAVTAIDKSHIEAFGDEEKIVDEVCSITEGMTDDGVVVVNSDEFNYYDKLRNLKVIRVSNTDKSADFYAEKISVTNKGITFDVIVTETGGKYSVVLNNVYAKHNVAIALQAFAIGWLFDEKPDNIVRGLQNYTTAGVRQNILRTEDDVILYADCFNAVAKSVKSAVNGCEQIPIVQGGRRIAVLGDIAESGDFAQSEHAEIIDIINKSSFDCLITLGDNLKKAVTTCSIRNSLSVICCGSREEIAKQLQNMVKTGDIVLFKGSHSALLENVIELVWPKLFRETQIAERKEYHQWFDRIKRS